MKLLMTVDAVGGVWSYAQELAAALATYDVQVVMAVMGPAPTQAQRSDMQRLSNVELVCKDFRLEWMSDPWSDIDAAGDWLLQLAASTRADLIHLNGYVHAALPWRVPLLVVAHSCVLSWWQAVHGHAAPIGWREYRRRVAAGMQAADHLVAPTSAFLSQLKQHYFSLPPATVIHNARSANNLFTATRATQPMVFSAGRLWDEAKNVATLDAAARDLAWPVFIAGDTLGPYHRPARLSHAHALGALSGTELAAWLRRSSIYASAALYEPFGLAILEAALNSCALVLSDIPTLRELWQDAAVFVAARDANAWRAALTELSAAPARLSKLSRAARKRAARYSPPRMADAYFALYRQLLRSTTERSGKNVAPSAAAHRVAV